VPGEKGAHVLNTFRTKLLLSPYLLLSLTSVIWAGNFIVGRALREDISAVELNLWRWTLALVILFPLSYRQLRQHWPLLIQHWRLLSLLGFSGIAAFHTSVYAALKTTTAVNAILFLSLSPVLIVIGSRISGKDSITGRQLLGILVSLAGAIVLVVRGEFATLVDLHFYRGDLWMLFAVTMWSVYSILLKQKPAALPQLSMLTGSAICAVAMLLLIFVFTQHGHSSVAWSGRVIFALLYVGILASIVAFLFWNKGVAEVGPNRAGVFLHLMPVFGALLSVVFLNEGIAVYHLVGAALVFSGLTLSTRPASRKREKHL
jgi:drug/metabolite transporter (DMT)-like permease